MTHRTDTTVKPSRLPFLTRLRQRRAERAVDEREHDAWLHSLHEQPYDANDPDAYDTDGDHHD